MAQVRLARVIPSMHVHRCVALWLISLRPSPVFYFVPPFSFQPFLMFNSEFNERFRSNPLCDFRLGTVATSDHETPLTNLAASVQRTKQVIYRDSVAGAVRRGEGCISLWQGDWEGIWSTSRWRKGKIWMDEGQQHHRRHEGCDVYVSIEDVNDAETSDAFHDLRVTIQHAPEIIQIRASDERPTGWLGKERRYDFLHSWTVEMRCCDTRLETVQKAQTKDCGQSPRLSTGRGANTGRA